MSALQRLFILTCAIFIVITCVSAQKIGAERWKRFSSKAGGFSILLPGDPHESTYNFNDTIRYSADVEADEGDFNAMSWALPKPPSREDAPRLLDNLQASVADQARGEIVSHEDIVVQGMPGRRISLELQRGRPQTSAYEMLVLTGTRMFQIIAFSGETNLDPKDVDHFFQSFKIDSPKFNEKDR